MKRIFISLLILFVVSIPLATHFSAQITENDITATFSAEKYLAMGKIRVEKHGDVLLKACNDIASSRAELSVYTILEHCKTDKRLCMSDEDLANYVANFYITTLVDCLLVAEVDSDDGKGDTDQSKKRDFNI